MGQTQSATIDLRNADFSKSLSLDGTYEFYWDQLLLPGQLDTLTPGYFPFPSLWNNQFVGDKHLNANGFATYRAIILLPERSDYTLYVEDVYSAFALYFNGKLIAKNGQVATTPEAYLPKWKPQFVALPNVSDTNELILQIANFDHSKGGALEGMQIGTSEVMAAEYLALLAYDLILTGSLLTGGLFFLGLYFFGRRDKAILYFALFCLIYSYRVIGFGYYVLHSLVDVSWYVTTRIEYLTLFLATFAFGRFVHHTFPLEAKKIIWDILDGICLLFIGLTLLFPVSVYSHLVEPFFGILLIYIALTFFIYVRAKINRRPDSTFGLISVGVVFLIFVYNILVYFGLLEENKAVSFWGYVSFFFSQSLILSFRFANSLKQAKEEAEKASQAKTDFLSTISHEIRTPLNAVVGISHFLLQDKPRKDQKENLISLKYSAENLTSLINDILDYNKLEFGSIEFEEMTVNLKEVITSIYRGYRVKAQAKGLDLNLEFDESIAIEIITDRTRLNQVLNNLLDNAIKFTKEGHVTLKVKRQGESRDRITIRYEVEDTGIGIPEDKLEQIFERFTQASSSTTREFGGSGLGLSIIKRLLELQGVAIQVRSELGAGTTFFFEQAFIRGVARKVAPVSMEDQEQGMVEKLHGRQVLLVEDNTMNVVVAKKFLKSWNMKIDLAENGEVAVEKASSNYYDIILMDLQMPVMDGYEATRAIRAAKNSVPIVALTASALVRVQEKVLHYGMNDYITKPFDPEELRKKLVKNIRG